jgi:hypothetical protein
MKLLPLATGPASEPQKRRHQPRQATGNRGWEKYRQCLRWDFGFTCAFCLLHEADVARAGSEGWGTFTTEHFLPRSREPSRANDYTNCYWCCRRCNVSRNARDVETAEGRLLDPCRDAWAGALCVEAFEFRTVLPGDRDASRTLDVYDLNDPLKVRARRKRAQAISSALDLYRRSSAIIGRLSRQDKWFLSDLGTALRNQLEAAKRLVAFAAIPEDRVERCECQDEGEFSLPGWIDAQCIALS